MQDIETIDHKKTVKLSDVVVKTMHHWPWIVVSVMVCLILAVIYVQTRQPSYKRDASIVITDDSQQSSIGSQLSAFAGMGMFSSSTNIRDEVNKLMSPDLMMEVVERLDLNMFYELPGTLKNKVVYGDSVPLQIGLPDIKKNDVVQMEVKVAHNGDVTIKDIRLNDKKTDFKQKSPGRLGHPINTPVGNVIVSEGKNFEPGEDVAVNLTRLPVYKTASIYGNMVDIKLQDQFANTIEMSIIDKNIKRAEDVLNTIIQVYNENWVENKNEVSIATTNFINERLNSLARELGDVDKNIAEYQSANLVPDIATAAAQAIKDNDVARQQLLEYSNRLEVARLMRNYASDPANADAILPANIGIGNEGVVAQIQAYNNKLMARNRYLANSSESHPMIAAMDKELAQMRASLIAAIDNDCKTIKMRMANIQAQKGVAESAISRTPQQANYLQGIGREQKVKESLYLFLLQKREENELTRAFTAYNTEVIAKPYGENRPVSPRKVLICGFAFILGLFLPFGYTFCYEMLNTRVRSRKDIDHLKAPILGEIPAWKPSLKERKEMTAEGRNPNIAVEPGNRNVINDAFRVLRANLRFLSSEKRYFDGHHRGSVMMVTSMHAGSGKSFVTVNLAISLALRDSKVLVIDGDLRHGSTSETVGSPHKGLSNYLNGSTDDIDQLIVKGSLAKGADVLPVGQFPPNPTELLEGDRFRDLVDQMAHKYDYVFIDCPPVNAMADAKIIDKVSDRCIFVIRVGLFELEDLGQLDRMYEEKSLNNLSIVLNGVTDADSAKYGYADNYHKG